MIGMLARNWWALALRGVAAILFGLATFAFPGMALALLVLLFAAYLIVDGIFAIVAGVRAAEHQQRWGGLIAEGVLDIAAGAVIALWPGLSLLFFIYFAAFWAIVSGVALLAAAIRLHREHGEWLLWLSGVISVVWGALVLFFPIAGVIAWAFWIGAYALIFGVVMVMLAFRLKGGRVSPLPT
jgi:uncharacterized membrane protein HdeD (DUF308 family)